VWRGGGISWLVLFLLNLMTAVLAGRPTAASIASALVTIPAGFQQVSSPADQ
jgi:hypothetical protein